MSATRKAQTKPLPAGVCVVCGARWDECHETIGELADALRAIVKRHDDQANEDNPIPEGESGRCTCGCIDCRDALTALRLAERLA